MQLRKAYFKQLEEISSLKEQISLKDKRIRQLEEEISVLKLPIAREINVQDQSECWTSEKANATKICFEYHYQDRVIKMGNIFMAELILFKDVQEM